MAYEDDVAADLATAKNTKIAREAILEFKRACPPKVFDENIRRIADALHGGERLAWKGKRRVQEEVARVFNTFAMASEVDAAVMSEDAPF